MYILCMLYAQLEVCCVGYSQQTKPQAVKASVVLTYQSDGMSACWSM